MESQQTKRDLTLRPTVGLADGLTLQFAEGRWPGEIGDGVGLTEEGFALIEPCLRAACPEWTNMHRYGVFELSGPARATLANALRAEAARHDNVSNGPAPDKNLLGNLAGWLEDRSDERPVSILGI
jgi:hypothetical protein